MSGLFVEMFPSEVSIKAKEEVNFKSLIFETYSSGYFSAVY